MLTFLYTLATAMDPPFISGGYKLRGFTGTNIRAAENCTVFATELIARKPDEAGFMAVMKEKIMFFFDKVRQDKLTVAPYDQKNVDEGVVNVLPVSETISAITMETLVQYDYFQRYFFPGVSSLIQNGGKRVDSAPEDELADSITVAFSKVARLEYADDDEWKRSVLTFRIVWVRNMAMCYEVIETGILLQQQYNTGYFKGISDASMKALLLVWFSWC